MDNWQAGDLAWCVQSCPVTPILTRAGCIYTVTAVLPPDDETGLGLTFEDLPVVGRYRSGGMWLGYNAARFRKINPLTPEEHEETMHELLTGKPAKEPA